MYNKISKIFKKLSFKNKWFNKTIFKSFFNILVLEKIIFTKQILKTIFKIK